MVRKYIPVIIVIIILSIYLILMIKYQLRINNDYIIEQIHKPNYQIIEKIIKNRNLCVITGLLEQIKELHTWTPDYFKNKTPNEKIRIRETIIETQKTQYSYITMDKYIEKIINTPTKNYYWNSNTYLSNYDLHKPLNTFLSNYFQNINVLSSNSISMGAKSTKIGIQSKNNHLHLLGQIFGKKRIYLFNPNQKQFLYPNNKFLSNGSLSNINFWNVNYKLYPLFNKAQYIELILSPGQLLIIPPYWWYCYELLDINIDFEYYLDTPFSMITNIPNYSKNILHNCGLYSNNNCLCCHNK